MKAVCVCVQRIGFLSLQEAAVRCKIPVPLAAEKRIAKLIQGTLVNQKTREDLHKCSTN